MPRGISDEQKDLIKFEIEKLTPVAKIARVLGINKNHIYAYIRENGLTSPCDAKREKRIEANFDKDYHKKLLKEYLVSPEANRPKTPPPNDYGDKMKTSNPLDDIPILPT